MQADRLVVGGTLGAYDVGVYFRNLTLASLALQVFSIISFNRIAPRIYAYSRDGHLGRSLHTVGREYRMFLSLVAVVFFGAWMLDRALDNPAARLGVNFGFLLVLVAGVLLRSGADFMGLLLLSVKVDRLVFRNQVAAVALGVLALLVLATRFGLPGAIFGSLFTPLIYMALNGVAVRQRFRGREYRHDRP